MKRTIYLTVLVLILAVFSSCTSTSLSMKEPDNYVEMDKNDFEFSEQFTGQAQATYIFMIDFERLFSKKTAYVDRMTIPIIGSYIDAFDPISRVKAYALYDLMSQHPGYDVIFYPQYEVTVNAPIGLPIFVTYNVKATARLAKVKK